MSKNVKEIVSCWLKENGHDGLSHTGLQCGCELSNLAACGQLGQHCQSAYKFHCARCKKAPKCEHYYDNYGANYIMSPDKNFCKPQYRKETK